MRRPWIDGRALDHGRRRVGHHRLQHPTHVHRERLGGERLLQKLDVAVGLALGRQCMAGVVRHTAA